MIFVVYALGSVQIWSYEKLFRQLQSELRAGAQHRTDSVETEEDLEGDTPDPDASNPGAANAPKSGYALCPPFSLDLDSHYVCVCVYLCECVVITILERDC